MSARKASKARGEQPGEKDASMSARKASKARGEQPGEKDTSTMPTVGRQGQRAKARGTSAAGRKESPGPSHKTLGTARRGRRRAHSADSSRAVTPRKTRKSARTAPRGRRGRDALQPAKKKRAKQGAAGAEAPPEKLVVKMPRELKAWLITEWDLVTKRRHLYQLPAAKSVDALLEDYMAFRKARGGASNEHEVAGVVSGIKEHFNFMLGTELLYKLEKPQHAEILAARPNLPMSQIYGAPHMLRLCVRVGRTRACWWLDKASLPLLKSCLQDFLHYLANDGASLFSTCDYKVASADYIQKALRGPIPDPVMTAGRNCSRP